MRDFPSALHHFTFYFYTLPHISDEISCWLSVCLSVCRLSIFFWGGGGGGGGGDDNLNNCQWIFTKHSMCIGIVEIWFGIATG